jgi:protein-S-isoprenylcysteine O-methyltransferase Ste14
VHILDLAVLGIWIVFWSYWLISAIRNRSGYKRRHSNRSLLLFMAVLLVIWVFLSILVPAGLWEWSVIPDEIATGLFGIIITVTGLSFAVWARMHLGKNWSGRVAIKVNHKLIRTGPYQFVRNPIYTGILIGYAGTAIVIGELWAFLLILIAMAGFLIKIRVEEKVLLEEFGEAYSQYRKEVRALIPYII